MLSELELEFAQTRHRWKIFIELYESNENVELLNKSGAHIFSLFQKLVIDDTMMSLCRICDPEKSYGKENNSLRYHYEKSKSNLDSQLKVEIESLLDELKNKTENIRNMRNKAISHNDLEIALKQADLPQITYDEIEQSMDLICKILNKLFGTTGQYIPTTHGTSSHTLLEILGKNTANQPIQRT